MRKIRSIALVAAVALVLITLVAAATNAGKGNERNVAGAQASSQFSAHGIVPTSQQVATKANSDPLYQQLRQASSRPDAFTGNYATVNNLVFKRDAATFTMRTGEIYFLAPIEGRTTGAVFIGEGNVFVSPPTETERRSLAWFTDGPDLREDVTQLVFRFTDKTFEEIKQSPGVTMKTGGAQAERARGIFREKENTLRHSGPVR